MINLFFDGCSSGKAYGFRKEFGLKGEGIFTLSLYLHAGDISVPMSVNARKAVYDACYDCLHEWTQDEIRKFKKALKKDNAVCIWYSIKDTDEYLGMLAVLEYLEKKGKTIYLREYSAMVNVLPYLEDMQGKTVPEKKLLTYQEYERLMKEWQEIKQVNAELRIIKDGIIQNMPANYADKHIFEIVGDGEVPVSKIQYELLCGELPRMFAFINYRVRQLLNSGKLTMVQEGWTPDGATKKMKELSRAIVKVTKEEAHGI